MERRCWLAQEQVLRDDGDHGHRAEREHDLQAMGMGAASRSSGRPLVALVFGGRLSRSSTASRPLAASSGSTTASSAPGAVGAGAGPASGTGLRRARAARLDDDIVLVIGRHRLYGKTWGRRSHGSSFHVNAIIDDNPGGCPRPIISIELGACAPTSAAPPRTCGGGREAGRERPTARPRCAGCWRSPPPASSVGTWSLISPRLYAS